MKLRTHRTFPKAVSRLFSQAGVTLVELMISLVIGLIITGAIYTTYLSQQRSFAGQDQVAELNSRSKVALDMIVEDIREAGFGVPENIATIQRTEGCYGINGFREKINFIPGADDLTTSPDKITLLGGFRPIGKTRTAISSGSATIILASKAKTDLLEKSAGHLKEGSAYISIGGMSFALVESISGKTLTLKGATPVDKSFPAGIPVYLVENVTYQVVDDKLQRIRHPAAKGCTTDPETDTIAENVEDLQFVILDVNGDGIADRIRVNILAEAANPDPDFEGLGNPPSKVENRAHDLTNDSLRRRWWQMEVDLRNIQ